MIKSYRQRVQVLVNAPGRLDCELTRTARGILRDALRTVAPPTITALAEYIGRTRTSVVQLLDVLDLQNEYQDARLLHKIRKKVKDMQKREPRETIKDSVKNDENTMN